MRALPCLLLALGLARVAVAATEAPAPATGPGTHCGNLAASPDGTLWLTYYGPPPADAPAGARTLWLSRLAADAVAWDPPRAVITTPLLLENWADFASLVVGTDGALTAQWFQRAAPDARGYDGWYSRSEDGGRTWRAPAPLGHEFVALAPLSGGRTLAVWLESARTRDPHAAPRPRPAPGTPRPPPDPHAPHVPGMKLLARIVAPDGRALRDWVVDPDVCSCCQNAAAVLGDGRVFVAYRGRAPGEIRDSRWLVFDPATETWSPSAPLAADDWMIPACPVNGPAVDALGSKLAVSWFTAAGGQPRVQARYSADGARSLGAPVVVDLGRPMGRLDTVMLADGTALVTWLEAGQGAIEAGIYARRLFPDGALSAAVLVTATSQSRTSGFPRLARRPGGEVLMAWTQAGEENQVRVTRIDATGWSRGAASPAQLTLQSSGRPVRPEYCSP
jgi:hypothetical protein